MSFESARAVADAVLYEGYLLYPYRASSAKNQSRWQFGVVGPPGAAEAGVGEASSMRLESVLRVPTDVRSAVLTLHLRFLQLQLRQVCTAEGMRVDELLVDGVRWTTWDEAVEQELTFSWSLDLLRGDVMEAIEVPGREEIEVLRHTSGAVAGRILRTTRPLVGELRAHTSGDGEHRVLHLDLRNTGLGQADDKDAAIRASLIGTHVLIEATDFDFVSMIDPPTDAAELVAECSQDRCWPVLAGDPGDSDLLLGAPIILYDHPAIAPESPGSLFDGTEIDEILTLRVMTMTDEEKDEARATDPRAREIIDRCDRMSPETLQQMHGVLRQPRLEVPVVHTGGLERSGVADVRTIAPTSFDTGDLPWWSPEADEAVQPSLDAVVVDGVSVARGSLVRVHPSRRADAQDLFFAGQVDRVTAVLSDVDGGTHVALLLLDDPAAEINDLAGRFWYFDPDEITPLSPDEAAEVHSTRREEIRP